MSASEQGQSTDPVVETETAVDDAEASVVVADSPASPIERLETIRPRVMPILKSIVAEYTGRTNNGYPTIVDNIQSGGVFGLNLDPGWSVYFMTDGTDIFAELHETKLRTDTLSMANVEKFAARPSTERRMIDDSWRDSDFRNIVSELLHGWNYQQLRIYRVDS